MSLRLRALMRCWQGVYVCKFRSTRTRFQFKKTLPGEHSPENFCCVGPHFQACMHLADVFCLRCISEARKKHFRRNFRKCSRMRAIVPRLDVDFMFGRECVFVCFQLCAICTHTHTHTHTYTHTVHTHKMASEEYLSNTPSATHKLCNLAGSRYWPSRYSTIQCV